MGAVEAVDVEIDRTTEMRVTYDDGVTATFPLGALRRACPCAGCRGMRERGVEPGGDVAGIRVVDAELHGNWGVAVRWSDGHDTGIYAWEHLRTWWDAHQDSLP